MTVPGLHPGSAPARPTHQTATSTERIRSSRPRSSLTSAAAPAQREHLVRVELGTAPPARHLPPGLVDLQHRSSSDVPVVTRSAEPDGRRAPPRQPPDRQVHPPHRASGIRSTTVATMLSVIASRASGDARSTDPGQGSPTSRSTIRVPERRPQQHQTGRVVAHRPDPRRPRPDRQRPQRLQRVVGAPAETTATSRPSHATYSGSIPSSSDAPFTSGRTGTAPRRAPPRPATPPRPRCRSSRLPRVASRSSRTPPGTASSNAAVSSCSGAVSETMSAEMSSSPRASITVMPWSPIGPTPARRRPDTPPRPTTCTPGPAARPRPS